MKRRKLWDDQSMVRAMDAHKMGVNEAVAKHNVQLTMLKTGYLDK